MKLKVVQYESGAPFEGLAGPVHEHTAKAVIEANPDAELVAVDAPADWQPEDHSPVFFELKLPTNEPA